MVRGTHTPESWITAKGTPRKILIVNFWGLGDVVLSMPAIHAIRRLFPRAALSLAGRSGAVEILRGEPILDQVISIPFTERSTMLGDLSNIAGAIQTIRAMRIDLLINLSSFLTPVSYLRSSIFNYLCRAQRIVGGDWRDCQTVLPRHESVQYRVLLHESEMKFRIARRLLPKPANIVPTLTPRQDWCNQLPALRRNSGAHHLIGLVPGGSRPSRQWPIQCFVQCAKHLSQDPRVQLVILGSPRETPLAHQIMAACGSNPIDLCGTVETSLLPTLINNLDLVISNDCGPMHVAAAVGTPLVAILGSESPTRYAPIVSPMKSTIFYRSYQCSPCLRITCSHQSCMSWIHPEAVAHAALQLLEKRHESRRGDAPAGPHGMAFSSHAQAQEANEFGGVLPLGAG